MKNEHLPSDLQPWLLRLRRGRAPNCSASGSVVGIALAAAGVAAVVLNLWGNRFLRWLDRDSEGEDGADGDGLAVDASGLKLRRESFGGIVAWGEPAALLYVDHPTARAALEHGAEQVGLDSEGDIEGALRSPTEVHLAVTERCPVACTGCYIGAGPQNEVAEADTDELYGALEKLAAMGVFEVAFGGGESLMNEQVFKLAEHARDLGVVPNLTTSGFGLTPARARRMRGLFGQVNVSIDGLAEGYRAVRGWDGFELGMQALKTLSEAGVAAGVNTVLTGSNLAEMPALAEVLAGLRIAEWQWLRFKPTGRGINSYEQMRLSPEQGLELWPLAVQVEKRWALTLRFDCALVPFLAAHRLPINLMRRLGIGGCNGGQALWSRSAIGTWGPCSFAVEGDKGAGDSLVIASDGIGGPGAVGQQEATGLRDLWRSEPQMTRWRQRGLQPPEPCGSCAYKELCRGGCRVVAGHLSGDELAPDPECPRVLSL